MIYWLIPYLVAYNGSDLGDWRYGPEHVFKTEVRSTATTDDLTEMHSNIDIYLACRPAGTEDDEGEARLMIRCRIESATIDNWDIEANATSSSVSHSPEPFEFGNVVFEVGFLEWGLRMIFLPEANVTCRNTMVFSIFSSVHWGVIVSEKKLKRYIQAEKSMIGGCRTYFDFSRKASSKEETNVEKVIDGYRFDVPGFEGRTKDEPIVIEKKRKVPTCGPRNQLYLFGYCVKKESDKKNGLWTNARVTSSRSRFYLGRNSFSAYTRITGTLEILSARDKTMRSFMNVDESIRLSLDAIRPAKEALQRIPREANTGPIPQRNWPRKNVGGTEPRWAP